MLSKLTDLLQSWADEEFHSNACKLIRTKHAIKDLVGNKRNTELEKSLTDMIIFAENFKLLKSSGEPLALDLHHEVTFHPDNSFTVRKLSV
ncbi:hypothetical protein [Shewanella baltica]|uniref:hypothetical protein n=1 Tax=Shewanella baltica TaxID=62322 RepID=UPI003D7A67E1